MTEQRTLREKLHFIRRPTPSVRIMRRYLIQVFTGAGFLGFLLGSMVMQYLVTKDYFSLFVGIVIIIPLVGFSILVLATNASEEIEKVVRRGEWP